MANLKQELIKNATEQLKKYEDSVQSLHNIIEWANGFDDGQEFNGFIFMPGVYPRAVCMSPGGAQELANELTTRYGLTFDKSFDDREGEYKYHSASINGFRFYVEGKPPTSCNLRRIVETKESVRYEIDCEPEPVEVPA